MSTCSRYAAAVNIEFVLDSYCGLHPVKSTLNSYVHVENIVAVDVNADACQLEASIFFKA